MIDIVRRVFPAFSKITSRDYNSVMQAIRQGLTPTSHNNDPNNHSAELEEYRNFNQELWRDHIKTQKDHYHSRLNRDFDKTVVLRTEYEKPRTYYGTSLVLFLLFDTQLYMGTSTYTTMLLTAGGAAAVFWHSMKNTPILPSVREIRLLENEQVEISFSDNKTETKTVALSDFKFNVAHNLESKSLGSALGGFVVRAGDSFYHINSNARMNRVLLDKLIK